MSEYLNFNNYNNNGNSSGSNASINSQRGTCRTCNDFKTWAKQQKRRLDSDQGSDDVSTSNGRSDYDMTTYPKDCPLDKDALGNATWSLLHTIGATYPDQPTDQQKKDVKDFFRILSRIYPCEYCANDLRKDLKEIPVDVSSQHALSQWLCKLHNRINLKLGKPLFDCTKVNERWRDGWLDGSCD